MKNQSVLGSTMGPRAAFPEIFQRVAEATFRPWWTAFSPSSPIQQAHRLLEGRQVCGKLVLTL